MLWRNSLKPLFQFQASHSVGKEMAVVVISLLFVLARLGDCLPRCNSMRFSDVPSRVVLADIVLEGKLVQFVSPGASELKDRLRNATFTVDTIYKGRLREAPDSVNQMVKGEQMEAINRVHDEQHGKVTVGLTNELHSCLRTAMKVGRRYVVFLNETKTYSNEPDVFYRASGAPVALSTKVIRDVKAFCCKTCVQYPKARLSEEITTFWSKGDEVKLTCLLDGSPPPLVSWYKDDQILNTTGNHQVINRNSSSTLVIGKADYTDGGNYVCAAENVLGRASSRNKAVIIEPETLALNDASSDHSKLCDKQTYCLNGGTCKIDTELNTQYCVCASGYTGPRCQNKGDELGIGGLEDILVILCIFLMILLLMTTFAILYCLAKFRHDFEEHQNRRLALMEEMRRTNGRVEKFYHRENRSSELVESLEASLPRRQTMKEVTEGVTSMECITTTGAAAAATSLPCKPTPSAFHETTSAAMFSQPTVASDGRFTSSKAGSSWHSHPEEVSKYAGTTATNSNTSMRGVPVPSPPTIDRGYPIEGKVKKMESGSGEVVQKNEHGKSRASADLPGYEYRVKEPISECVREIRSDRDVNDRRKETSTSFLSQHRPPIATEAAAAARNQPVYDDIKALLLELGVNEELERNTSATKT